MSEQNQERIRRKVESGLYASEDDVISAALGLLEQLDPDLEQEMADIRDTVSRVVERSRTGKGVPPHIVFEELGRRSTAMARSRGAMIGLLDGHEYLDKRT